MHIGQLARLRAAASAKLADLDRKLAELARVREGLRTLLGECPGRGTLGQCPILGALSEDDA